MFRNSNYGSITDPEIGSEEISTEFDSLSYDIATNVFTINSSIKTLQDALKVIGTSNDNVGLRNKIHISQLSANQVALVTTKDINKLKKVPKNAKQEQLVDKIEGKFKDAIAKYYSLQMELAEKQKCHLSATVESSPFDNEDSEGQEKQEESSDLQFKEEMVLERESKLRQIEEDVLDVNQIIAELESLAHTHEGDITSRMEKEVDALLIEDRNKQLGGSSDSQNKSRKRLLILVIIALIATAALITILVTTLKK